MAIEFLLPIMLVLLIIQQANAQVGSLARPGCQEACGNITIPYPFGIGANCSGDEPFTVTCNNSFNPPRPFLNKISPEVLEISLEAGTVCVNNPVFISTCQNRTTKALDVSLARPFTFSATQNRFTAMGCDSHALIIQHGLVIGGCTSFCNSTSRKNSCYGVNCCQTRIPQSLRYINASFRDIDPENDQNSCKYAFIVEQNWFGSLTNMYRVESMEQVPAVLDWRTYGTCKSFRMLNASANRFLSLCAYYS